MHQLGGGMNDPYDNPGRSHDSSTSPIKDAYDFGEFAAIGMQPMSSPAKEKLKKINMKTQELKKMEGMEDITNFFSGVNTNSLDEDQEKEKEQLDRKLLEIMKKLNFRHRNPGAVYRHRKSQERLEYDIMTNFSGSKDNLYSVGPYQSGVSNYNTAQDYSTLDLNQTKSIKKTSNYELYNGERDNKTSSKKTKFPTVFVANETGGDIYRQHDGKT